MRPVQIRPLFFNPIEFMPSSFFCFREANDYLEALSNVCIRFSRSRDNLGCDTYYRISHQGLYNMWLEAFNNLPAVKYGLLTSGERYSLPLLHIRRLDTYLTLYGPSDDGTQEWDNHLQAFNEMVTHASTVAASFKSDDGQHTSFSMSGGLILPLVRLVQRCRHPLIRRTVIAILKRISRAEGPLTGPIAALVLERIVEIEEDASVEVRECGDIPEEARVTRLSVDVLGKDKGVRISYSRMKGYGSLAAVQEVIL